MGKKALQNTVSITLLIAAVLLFGTCINPVDIDDFIEDEKVQNIIHRNRVTLINHTSDNLAAGNERISGLNPNRYYMVMIEEMDEDENPTAFEYYSFVSAGGLLVANLANIGRVSGTVITGLNNHFRYTVWAASPITNISSMTLYDTNSVPPDNPVALPSGVLTEIGLTLAAPANNYHLDFGSAITIGWSYVIAPVPGVASPSETVANTTLQLRGANTTTDYVFINGNDHTSFRVLRIRIQAAAPVVPPATPNQITLTVTPVSLAEGGPYMAAIDLGSFTLAQLETADLTITFINGIGVNEFTNIQWRTSIGGNTVLSTTNTLRLNFPAGSINNGAVGLPTVNIYQYKTQGTHSIYLRATRGGVEWGGTIIYTVSN